MQIILGVPPQNSLGGIHKYDDADVGVPFINKADPNTPIYIRTIWGGQSKHLPIHFIRFDADGVASIVTRMRTRRCTIQPVKATLQVAMGVEP
jgi:hypothetical protein